MNLYRVTTVKTVYETFLVTAESHAAAREAVQDEVIESRVVVRDIPESDIEHPA